jgi:hypothetical protein
MLKGVETVPTPPLAKLPCLYITLELSLKKACHNKTGTVLEYVILTGLPTTT